MDFGAGVLPVSPGQSLSHSVQATPTLTSSRLSDHADTDDGLWHALVHLESAVTRERDSPGHGMPGAPRVFST